jgi:hypothetical protein
MLTSRWLILGELIFALASELADAVLLAPDYVQWEIYRWIPRGALVRWTAQDDV